MLLLKLLNRKLMKRYRWLEKKKPASLNHRYGENYPGRQKEGIILYYHREYKAGIMVVGPFGAYCPKEYFKRAI